MWTFCDIYQSLGILTENGWSGFSELEKYWLSSNDELNIEVNDDFNQIYIWRPAIHL